MPHTSGVHPLRKRQQHESEQYHIDQDDDDIQKQSMTVKKAKVNQSHQPGGQGGGHKWKLLSVAGSTFGTGFLAVQKNQTKKSDTRPLRLGFTFTFTSKMSPSRCLLVEPPFRGRKDALLMDTWSPGTSQDLAVFWGTPIRPMTHKHCFTFTCFTA